MDATVITPAPQKAADTRAIVGWANGLAGVLIFSGSLPATRVAVLAFDPVFLTLARAAIAGLLGLMLLALLKPRRPQRSDIAPLVIVALGVVVGFPLFTALALRFVTSAHAIVFIGLLPLATALFGTLRAGERPRPAFWVFSVTGAAVIAAYALRQDATTSLAGDGLMLAAILVCGLGYAEGARLSRRLGGWQVISWALVLSLPMSLPAALLTLPASWSGIGWPAVTALAYVSLFSMLIGFVFWYRGLALGGIAAVGQLQLLQPFFGFALAGILLGEEIGWTMIASAGAVVLCVAGARHFAGGPAAPAVPGQHEQPGATTAARLWRAWKHRREVARLLKVEDHMLADIGLTRQDVEGALATPLSTDPSHLLVRAREDRRQVLTTMPRRGLRR